MGESKFCGNGRKMYVAYLLNGIGFLSAYNAVVMVLDYFQFWYGTSIMYIIALCNTIPLIIILCFFSFYGTPENPGPVIQAGYALIATTMVLFCFINTFATTLIFCLMVGCGTAITQGLLFSSAGALPATYNIVFNMGIAASGFFMSAVRLVVKAAVPNVGLSALIYFILSICLTAAASLSCRYWIFRNPLFHEYQNQDEVPTEKTPLKKNSDSGTTIQVAEEKPKDLTNFGLFKIAILPICTVHLNYIVTLALFPGVCSEFRSGNAALGDGWFALICITIFGFCDVLSRQFLECLPHLTTSWNLALAIARIAFIPWFLYLVINPGSDANVYIAVALYGLTNGFCGSLAMIQGPQQVSDVSSKGRVGAMMAFFLTSGLTAGAVLGIVVKLYVLDAYVPIIHEVAVN